MDLKLYLNLYALLQRDVSTKEQQRAFGLEHAVLKHKPIAQLAAWEKRYIDLLKRPLLSERVTSYLYIMTFLLGTLSFILGLFSGIALLSYNGHEPVNVVYFMAMVIFFPLFTMLLALFAMFKSRSNSNILMHLTPAYWMEKIAARFAHKEESFKKHFNMDPILAKWIVLRRAQCMALLFSVGLLLALLGTVVTRDLAFAWSTTLKITPDGFYAFLNMLAFPWREFIPSAIPSLELIEHSQYFRLGERLSNEMITHVEQLGEWWKFLAMATLFYALFLRTILYLIVTIGYKRALKKSIFSLEGTSLLLNNMNKPFITTGALEGEGVVFSVSKDVQMLRELESVYDFIQGWALSSSFLEVLNEVMKVKAQHQVVEVGGSNTLSQDSEIARKSFGKVLLYVKAWEPPTLDILDYIELLLEYAGRVVIYPVGTENEGYQAKEKYIQIWVDKISMIDTSKIWIKVP